MLDRIRNVVTSLANNPALLQLLRDDPESFSQQLGLSVPEMHALNRAGDLVGKWGESFVARARETISAGCRKFSDGGDRQVLCAVDCGGNGPGDGSAVPITSILGLVGLVATVGTVGIVALSKSENEF